MKLAILTSNHLRHRYFINTLAQNFEVVGLVMEEKKRDPSKKGQGTNLEKVVKDYFNDREKSENYFFGEQENVIVPREKILAIEAGTLNNPEVVEKIKTWQPEYLAVFGSSILKNEIIEAFPGKIINMHLGLSPYYRGSGTNFWPLYDGKPEYVGVTVHYLDKGIDTGKIIKQGRPRIELGDTPHSLGNKTIIRGTEIMSEVLKRLADGEKIKGQAQDLSSGKLCLFKDFEPEPLLKMLANFEQGMIEEYLAKERQGLIKVKIVD